MPTMVKMIAEPSRAQSAWSGAPWVRKFHNQRIREILVVTWPYARPPARPSVCTQGRSVGPGEEARRKFSSTGGKRNLGTDSHPTISERSSECWLLIGQKNALYCCAQSANSISWVRTRLDSITACLAHAPKKCTQSGNFQFHINSSFQNTVYPKIKDAFPKNKPELTGNRYSRLHRSRLRKVSSIWKKKIMKDNSIRTHDLDGPVYYVNH